MIGAVHDTESDQLYNVCEWANNARPQYMLRQEKRSADDSLKMHP